MTSKALLKGWPVVPSSYNASVPDPGGGVPKPPAGFAYVMNDAGGYVLNENGGYILAETL